MSPHFISLVLATGMTFAGAPTVGIVATDPMASPTFPAAVYDQLKVRDSAECSALGVASTELKAALVVLTDPALLPAAVPVRAAGCLVSMFPADVEVETAIMAWIGDPERQGLALVALARTDALPEAAAVRIVTAGRQSAVTRVATAANALRTTSLHAAVRALP